MTYWGDIQDAVSRRATTAEIWDAIKAVAAAQPGGAPLPSLQGVNEVRSAAAAIRNAGENLSKALAVEQRTGLPQGIEPSMMTVAPWSRDAQSIATLAQYQVRFQATFTAIDGSQFQQWLTAKFTPDTMPSTVGELADALAVSPAIDTPPAGSSLSDIGTSQITIV